MQFRGNIKSTLNSQKLHLGDPTRISGIRLSDLLKTHQSYIVPEMLQFPKKRRGADSGEFRKVLIFLRGPVNGRLSLINESRRFPRTQNLIFVVSLGPQFTVSIVFDDRI